MRLRSFLIFLATACGGGPIEMPDSGDGDSGLDGGPVVLCAADPDCSDTSFCTGTERCMPGEPGTDSRGCLPGASPCTSDQICDEGADTCTGTACTNEDDDGFSTCMGDCDDTRSDINPGVGERCVPGDPTDEDCNPLTYGFLDRDVDGAGDAQCFNVGPDGVEHHGRDCDDDNSLVQDARACGLGACAGMQACDNGEWSTCDGPPPASQEACDGIDGDCDGLGDADDSNVMGVGEACGGTSGSCRPGARACLAGELSCTGVEPAIEACNHLDDDCDDSTDEAVGAPTCQRTFPSTTSSSFTCYASACGAFELGGTSGTANTSPKAAFVSAWSGDLGWWSSFEARVRVRPLVSGTRPIGTVSLILTPDRGAGPEDATTLTEGVSRPTRSAPALYVSVYQAALGLGYMMSSLPTGGDLTVIDTLGACGAWSPTETQTLTIRLENQGPRVVARVSRSGCATVQMEHTFPLERTPAEPGYRSDYYGARPDYPRYYVGVSVDNDAGLGAVLEQISIGRNSVSTTPDCVGCM